MPFKDLPQVLFLCYEENKISDEEFLLLYDEYPSKNPDFAVGQNLFRTSNLIGYCWPEALLFQSWGSLLVLFGLGISIVY